MQSDKIVFGLDICTTKIVCLAGRLNEYGKLEVLGVGQSKSLGEYLMAKVIKVPTSILGDK